MSAHLRVFQAGRSLRTAMQLRLHLGNANGLMPIRWAAVVCVRNSARLGNYPSC